LNAFKSERIILRLIEESRKVAGIDDQAYFNCLIRYYGSHTFSEDSIQKNVFVFEFANQNNLSEWIDKKDFTWLMRLNVSHQVTMGLIALHEKCQYPIVHGDLKTSNILLHQDNGNLFAKIGDFGFSGICDDTTINQYYSPLYAEPQILLEDCPFNTKGDIWSMGVMLYELFAQQQSYSGHKLYNFDRLVAWVVTNKQINQISTPDLYEKQAQAQVSKALAHVKKLESNLELESSSNSKTSDSLNEARLRLQETKDAVEEAKNRAKKMNSIIKSCCMFYRKDRPTATELKTQLNEIRQPSIKNTN
jgi:serine/threonine protein kinase